MEEEDEIKKEEEDRGGEGEGAGEGGLKEGGDVTHLTHAQLEGASLLFKLLSNLSSAHLVSHHPVLTS